eukprot:5620131-Alexandrium_andersonii.AAC.1
MHGFSQAGAAVVAGSDDPWHEDVEDWANSETRGQYKARFAHLHGNVASSTRAEVAALLLALQKSGGLHVLTDSMAM